MADDFHDLSSARMPQPQKTVTSKTGRTHNCFVPIPMCLMCLVVNLSARIHQGRLRLFAISQFSRSGCKHAVTSTLPIGWRGWPTGRVRSYVLFQSSGTTQTRGTPDSPIFSSPFRDCNWRVQRACYSSGLQSANLHWRNSLPSRWGEGGRSPGVGKPWPTPSTARSNRRPEPRTATVNF